MKFEKLTCEECGSPASSTWESIPGQALLSEPDEFGEVEYEGETEVFWDGQTTDENAEGVLLGCDCGHSWRSKLVPEGR